MIAIKSDADISAMRQAGRIAGLCLRDACRMVAPGVTTASIDQFVRKFLAENGAKASFLGYRGYPSAICISVNDEVIHGIPGRRKLRDGDVVSLDVGAYINGFHGDTAATVICGKADPEAMRLVKVTRECFYKALEFAKTGFRVTDISRAVQQHAEGAGYSVVKDYTGHGIGKALHEDPEVPNFISQRGGVRLMAGMTICVEPMINSGTDSINVLRDDWTVVTADKKLSAHYEHTILITDGEPELLTLVEGSL